MTSKADGLDSQLINMMSEKDQAIRELESLKKQVAQRDSFIAQLQRQQA